MKLICAWIFLSLGIYTSISAQENRTVKKETKAVSKAEMLTIDDITFDCRVLRHYTEDALRKMPAKKRKQLQFLYNNSYVIVNSEACSEISVLDIDIAKLETFRKEDDEVITEYGNNCKVKVKLISRKDLQKVFDSFN